MGEMCVTQVTGAKHHWVHDVPREGSHNARTLQHEDLVMHGYLLDLLLVEPQVAHP